MKTIILASMIFVLAACGKEGGLPPVSSPMSEPAKPVPMIFDCPDGTVRECTAWACRCFDQANGKYIPGVWKPKN